MSLTSSTHSLHSQATPNPKDTALFHHQPIYITLLRTLTRLSNTLLPLASATSAATDLTPQQRQTLHDLLSPLPYHRTKTLHTIEHARTLLLQLEQSAQQIKIQRVKREVVRDLAEKRKVVRRLRGVVEELGREAERREKKERAREEEDAKGEAGGEETVEELLGLPALEEEDRDRNRNDATVNRAQGGQEDHAVQEQPSSETNNASPPPSTSMSEEAPVQNYHQQQQNSDLFSTTSNELRNRRPAPPSVEPSLRHDRHTQTSLTSSLLTLASQLKSQSQRLSTTLQTTDASHLSRALQGLDANAAGLEGASKKMGVLKRMSEGEWWWGRMMLYAWIVAGWVVAVGLVMVGPKLRF